MFINFNDQAALIMYFMNHFKTNKIEFSSEEVLSFDYSKYQLIVNSDEISRSTIIEMVKK